MTAEVIVLPRCYWPEEPPARMERVQERVHRARARLLARTVDRVPVVLIRRTELGRREKNAFELGRDCGRCRPTGCP